MEVTLSKFETYRLGNLLGGTKFTQLQVARVLGDRFT